MLHSPAFRFPGRPPTGAKLALKPFHVCGIRVRLQVGSRSRDLALFDLALDSKLRGCDLVKLRVGDVTTASGVRSRVMVLQQKTGRAVQFEITEQARRSIAAWIDRRALGSDDFLFPSRVRHGRPITTRQYARGWLTNGSSSSGWTRPDTALIACGGRRWRCSTKRLAICEPASCCSGTPSWRARCATLVSRWMMPWRCRKRWRF